MLSYTTIPPSSTIIDISRYFHSILLLQPILLLMFRDVFTLYYILFNPILLLTFRDFSTLYYYSALYYCRSDAFVSSKLDYYNGILYGLLQNQIQKLQRLQNSAARLVTRTKMSEHITPVSLLISTDFLFNKELYLSSSSTLTKPSKVWPLITSQLY